MTPDQRARLEAERDCIEATLAMLAEDHHGTRVQCGGHHDQRRPAGRTVISRFVVLYADGGIGTLCARCAYSWTTAVIARIPLRYPAAR